MTLLELSSIVEGLGLSHKQLRFSVCQGKGWITTDCEQTIRALCALYNHRIVVAAALRAQAESMP